MKRMPFNKIQHPLLNALADLAAVSVLGLILLVTIPVFADSFPELITSVGGGFDNTGGSISADGRYVVFTSSANTIVPNDTNHNSDPLHYIVGYDVFLRDRLSATISRISVASDGSQAFGDSSGYSISADGRYVTFASNAANLVPNDTNNAQDIFLHDNSTGVTTRISLGIGGQEANSQSYYSDISADGRYVAYISAASNIVASDTNNTADVFVRDLQTGVTWRADV